MLTILSFTMLGRTHAKFVSRINFNGEDQLAGFNITCGGYKDTETSLTTTIAPGESKGLVAKISYFSQVPTEFLNVTTTYLQATGVLSDFKALLAAYEDYKQIHNPNGKAPAKLSECFMVSLTETSFAKVIAKELYTNHGLEKLASTAVGPMPETATTALNLEIPMYITWVEHNDPDWDTWDTFLGEQFAQSDVETTLSLKLNIRAQQVIGDVTLPSVPIIVDGKEVGSFHLSDDLNLNDSITQANLGITTDNSIGWYLDEALTEPAPDDYIPTEGTTVYTKMATLDKLTISSNGAIRCKNTNIEGEVVIPKTVNGKPVTIIPGYAFSNCENITNVFIPTGIEIIDTAAFRDCTNLQSIEIPSTVKTIGLWAFKNNTSLTNISIPSDIESIDAGAFNSCTSLEYNQYDNAYYLGNEKDPYVACMKAINTNITSNELHNSTKIIYGQAFYNCSNLTSELLIPSGVTSIGADAFKGCSGLTGNLVIPNGVTSIKDWTFYNCRGLTGDLVIPSGVTSIGSHAFQGCRGLTGDLVIPSGVTSIGYAAFSDCRGLTGDLVIPNSVTSIGSSAFSDCSGFTGNLVIPNSVTSIGNSAFNNCSGLTGNLVIPNSVTSIDNSTFRECRGLTGDLIIPNGVTSIGNSAFYNCSGLTGDLVIPNGVTSIGEFAFNNCSGLTGDLVIPSGVTSIGYCAFQNCRGLTSVIIPNSVTSIGNNAFYNCSGLTKVVIDSSVVATNNTYLQYLNIRSGTYYKVTHVYIKNTITGTLGTNLTSYFTKQATSDKEGYDLWIKK